MKTTASFPTIAAVHPLADKRLRVDFSNGEVRIYDCRPLMNQHPFRALEDESLFTRVHADPHGYAVIWNDDLDLAESELWLNGTPVKPGAVSNCGPSDR